MMITTRIYFAAFVLSALLLFLDCQNNDVRLHFDRKKWNEQVDPLYPSKYRQKMLLDLTNNYKLKGLKYSEVVELLGIPDSKDSKTLSYRILVDYKQDIDPVYTKDLDLTFSQDSIITSFKVTEWRKE